MSSPLPIALKLRASISALVIPPLLSLISFSRLCAWLGRSGPRVITTANDPAELAVWVDDLLYTLPGPWRHTCLKRSAILYYLLRRDGIPVELCIGVRREPDGPLTAHAWLLYAGVPYLERASSPSTTHTMIARFPEQQDPGG